jgi:hypothetical protein
MSIIFGTDGIRVSFQPVNSRLIRGEGAITSLWRLISQSYRLQDNKVLDNTTEIRTRLISNNSEVTQIYCSYYMHKSCNY